MAILCIYIGLLLLGGLLGYFLGKSKISLLFSALFAVALVMCAFEVLPFTASRWLLAILGFVFLIRVLRTRKFMPAGLMLSLTLLAMILLWIL